MCGRVRLSSDVSEIKRSFPSRRTGQLRTLRRVGTPRPLTNCRSFASMRRRGTKPKLGALGARAVLGEGHQRRLRGHQRKAEGIAHQPKRHPATSDQDAQDAQDAHHRGRTTTRLARNPSPTGSEGPESKSRSPPWRTGFARDQPSRTRPFVIRGQMGPAF
jgi:hypothetical protein